jgi:hypothetical protein
MDRWKDGTDEKIHRKEKIKPGSAALRVIKQSLRPGEEEPGGQFLYHGPAPARGNLTT